MRAFIAEEDLATRLVLEASLREWGYEPVVAAHGTEAWELLRDGGTPGLVLLDWRLPGVDGVELCRRIRDLPQEPGPYVVLLTTGAETADLTTAVDAGADAYLTKPFDAQELRARLQAGARIIRQQESLARRVRELEDTLAEARRLQGMLPICAYCKRIRNERNFWEQIEAYIAAHSGATFSHSVCPDCYDAVVRPELDALEGPGAAAHAAAPSPE